MRHSRLSSQSLLLLTLFLLITPQVLATDELYDYNRLTLNLHLENVVSVTPSSNQARVEELVAELLWWPRNSYRQTVEQLVTNPVSTSEGDARRFIWHHPSLGDHHFSLDAQVKTTDQPLPVTEHIPFPIESLPATLTPYMLPSKLIDTNEDIEAQALALAAGKDDLFQVVYSVADWVTTNIKYNLSSIAATASEPSSWVFANREGVCDEMTSLFISMLRTLNIPARFVSGVSYTNLPEFAEPWGGHGWAEVWFPNVGWVPFDVTYGTYGYVDATHIKLQESVDAGQNSVDFSMTARDANLLTRSLDMRVRVLQKWKLQHEPFSVTLTPFAQSVSTQSYQLITATVKNNLAQYVSARLQLARTRNLELFGSLTRNVLLKPKETKKLFFLLRTEGLEPGFRYTFPVELYAGFRKVASTSFTAEAGAPQYDRSTFEQYLTTATKERPYTQVALSCSPSPSKARVGEEVTIRCILTNEGDARLQAVEACIAQECRRLDLAPSPGNTTAEFSSKFSCASPGVKSILTTTSNRIMSVAAITTYTCLDEAKVVISNLTAPTSLAYDERGTISFTLRRESESLPVNLTVAVLHDNFRQEWTVERLSTPQRFTLSLDGSQLDLRDNKVTVRVAYFDELGKEQETERSLEIAPRDFTTLQKVSVALQNIERWLENLIKV